MIAIDYSYFEQTSLIEVVVYVLIGGLILFFLVWIINLLRRFLRRPELEGLDRKGIQTRWQEIESMLGKGSEMTDKVAILEADKLLDHALKAMAMPGTTLGERLKVATYKFPKLQRVWWSHKLRNQLVHEASFSVSHRSAKSAVDGFKNALKELGVL